MYLAQLKIRNFRCFDSSEHIINFNRGLSVLVGENDSGKSAILDAIRYVLGTTDQLWSRVEVTDFHNEDMSLEISIVCVFRDLTTEEKAAFLECLSHDENSDMCLYLNWSCKYLQNFTIPRTSTSLVTGIHADGAQLPFEARELLRVTYLRALRDAYTEMQAGRNSRLSQILHSVPDINEGNDYSENVELNSLSILGIVNLTNKLLSENKKLSETNKTLRNIVNENMSIRGDEMNTGFSVSGIDDKEQRKISLLLEKLSLDISRNGTNFKGKMGLGTSNILSMACELLLNNHQKQSSFLLIEEPEAHIHAQRQLRLMQSLQNIAADESKYNQIIMTTHSPLLASVVHLDNMMLVKDSIVYPLCKGKTKLDASDYKFLEKYLDATKANLFFAKGVLIVEGPAEELLLPTIASILGKDFTKCGISIVDARGTGLSRFSKIFQRANENSKIDIKVACITDRDIMPDCATSICKGYNNRADFPKKRHWHCESDFADLASIDAKIKEKKKNDGQNVKTFVSDHWTFEYDLAYSGLADDIIEAFDFKENEDGETEKTNIKNDVLARRKQDEKSAYIYSFFDKKKQSKAIVAQNLSINLEKKYSSCPDELKRKLPKYILEALEYIVPEESV